MWTTICIIIVILAVAATGILVAKNTRESFESNDPKERLKSCVSYLKNAPQRADFFTDVGDFNSACMKERFCLSTCLRDVPPVDQQLIMTELTNSNVLTCQTNPSS